MDTKIEKKDVEIRIGYKIIQNQSKTKIDIRTELDINLDMDIKAKMDIED